MRPSIKYLSDAEVVRVHEKALEMLEDLGMKFEGGRGKRILCKSRGRSVRTNRENTAQHHRGRIKDGSKARGIRFIWKDTG